MGQSCIRFQQVTFRYEAAATTLFQDLSLHVPRGWSGVVGANGAGKTTLLYLAAGILEPDSGSIARPAFTVYCPQRTDNRPEYFQDFLISTTKNAYIIRDQLHIQEDWNERWQTLSHGERKRAQIGIALWREPEVLAIDEPTNHIDREARALIATALHAFRGVGLLVSHDRDLLDSLCQQCLFVEPPTVITRPGGVTKGLQIDRQEQQTLQKQQLQKKQEYNRLHREAVKRRELGQQADKRRSKRGIAKKDHDAKAKINQARVTGKDAVGGKLLRQLDGRLQQARQQVEQTRFKKEFTLGIWLPGARSPRDVLLHLPAGSLALGEQKRLTFPELFVTPTDRIALIGPNGTGKSTLIRHLVTQINAPQEHVTYLPQEIEAQQSRKILAQAQRLPHEQLGFLMTIISRLGSRPQRLLESSIPSPGETRKLLLALGMTRAPHIIIMDEPTNHIDLPSIECLEQALAECPCCLLLVSHDRRFLQALTEKTWEIRKGTESEQGCTLQIW